MVKHYFNYGDPITSRGMASAISLPHGPGPICGFGSGKIVTSSNSTPQIKLYPYGIGDVGGLESSLNSPFKKSIRDRIKQHELYIQGTNPTDEALKVNFALITKDGTLYRDSLQEIDLVISGSKGTQNEVIVVAEHNPLEVAIDNPVVLKAYWNSNDDVSFFDIYQKSLDIYYREGNMATPSVREAHDPYLNNLDGDLITYEELCSKVFNDLVNTELGSNGKTLTLIGIYGTGTNKNTQLVEPFAITPYEGIFPMELPYTSATHSFFTKAVRRLEKFLGYDDLDQVVVDDDGDGNPEDVINNIFDLLKRIGQDPVGTIKAYAGGDVPSGFLKCDGSIYKIPEEGAEDSATAGTYVSLYKVIGTTYNGDNTPEGYFRVPNLSGRTLFGVDTNDSAFSAPGIMGGQNEVTLQVDQTPLPEHKHTINSSTFSTQYWRRIDKQTDRDANALTNEGGDGTASNLGTHTHDMNNSSDTRTIKAHENKPKYCTVTYLIKALRL